MAGNPDFDVIIVGGSYAGLSAAMALGRLLRNVLVIDSGLPANRQTPHSHNFITQDGKKPSTIVGEAKTQVLEYGTVRFQNGFAVSGKKIKDGFAITTQAAERFTAKKLIFASGITDIMPDIKGFRACWGISVIHCPYCHGYEFRRQKTGILLNGEKAFHLTSLVHNLTDDMTILTSGKAAFTLDQFEKLDKHNIHIIENEIVEIEHEDGRIKHVLFKDGSNISLNALYSPVPFKQHSDIPVELGCELTAHGYINVDNFQKTNVEGVFACGDNSNMMRSVSNAVHTGSMAGAMVNKELTDERF